MSIARWGHLLLVKWGSERNTVTMGTNGALSKPLHSRSVEQRIEVVKGRVYIHPLPQLLDNIGYLIVCTPPPRSDAPILGLIVDCADAESIWDQVELIRDVHYSHIRNSIAIHSILSTHKHHDHTAGNRDMIYHPTVGVTLKQIYGGAVDNVPYATQQVTNGSFISLPFVGDNDMGSLIEIECIAVPSHTRGSIVYNLRNLVSTSENSARGEHGTPNSLVVSHLFAGDAMFSGGCGVAFEADSEFPKDMSADGKTVNNRFKPGAGLLSIERCFCEIMRRALHDDEAITNERGCSMSSQMLIYPGHEYTLDLLQRQLNRSHEYSHFNRHDPATFFEVVSQYFVAGHRRHLPKSTRLLTVPTTMKRELKINPYLRSLKKRGEHLLTAVSLWYKYGFRTSNIEKATGSGDSTFLAMPLSQFDGVDYINSNMSEKSESSEYIWNHDHHDVNKSVFSTVYSADLESIIDGLKCGKLNSKKAAKKLSRLTDRLEESTVTRRPIPDRLPSEKNMYLGLLALSVLGSAPSGITHGDSQTMNLASPVDNSDHLLISKDLLIRSLRRLGLLPSWQSDPEGKDEVTQMISLLWQEATSDLFSLGYIHKSNEEDIEDSNGDLIELGILKLTLYSLTQKTSCFHKVCMPCGSKPSRCNSNPEGARRKDMKRSGGELVRHDIFQCPMCSNVMGCRGHDEAFNQSPPEPIRPSTVKIANSPSRGSRNGDLDGNIELKVVSVANAIPAGRRSPPL